MWQRAAARCSARRFTSVAPSSHSQVPWFIDSLEPSFTPKTFSPEQPPPPLPPGVPAVLHDLHAQLVQSPYLEPSKLLVRDPIPRPPGPPLPISTPRGRRKRGATYGGEGLLEPGNLWNWIVLAQVKEGTEKRGSIESVVRLVRKTLLSTDPSLQLPRNARKGIYDEWAMVDAGEFAVHVLSAAARGRYFGDRSLW